MANFKTVSLADQVFEKLENDIITGVYSKGELLTELKLVEQLGVRQRDSQKSEGPHLGSSVSVQLEGGGWSRSVTEGWDGQANLP